MAGERECGDTTQRGGTQTIGVDACAALSEAAVGESRTGSLNLTGTLVQGFERFNAAAHSIEVIDAMVDADLAADQIGSR